MNLDLELFEAGYCTHKANMVLKDEDDKTMKFPALFALITHPVHGHILFDTGYAERFFEVTKSFPFNIYAKMTPVYLKKEESAASQLKKRGILPEEIPYVFISHFHADHISGLKDFTSSTFLCSKKGYEDIKDKKGINAVRRAFIPSLLPNDFELRVEFIEDKPIWSNQHSLQSYGLKAFQETFDRIYDVFGDGSLLSTELSGHAAGQYGLFLQSLGVEYFLIADATWTSRSFKENIKPHSMAKLIMSSSTDYFSNFNKLYELHKKAPAIKIIPSHCSKIAEEMVNQNE